MKTNLKKFTSRHITIKYLIKKTEDRSGKQLEKQRYLQRESIQMTGEDIKHERQQKVVRSFLRSERKALSILIFI